jgi:tight adherence protein B
LRIDHRLARASTARAVHGHRRGVGAAVLGLHQRRASARIGALVGGAGAAIGVAPSGAGGSLGCGLAAAAVTGIGLLLLRRAGERHRRAREVAEVSQALAVLAGELDAGATPHAALTAIGPVGERLAVLATPMPALDESGRDDGRLLAGEVGPGATDALERVATAWRMSSDSGIALVDVVAQVRADLAASAATRREVNAIVSGPRASAVLLALLPVLGVGLGSAMGANPVAILLTTPAGRLLLAAGLVLDAVGLLWTDALIARAQR